jgi:putative NADH-flavin reductase
MGVLLIIIKMKIAIFGSTGFLGKVLLKTALDNGYQVKILVRNPDKLGAFKNKVEFIHGNILNANDVRNTVSGTEAVLSTIGPPAKNPGDPEIYKKSMENIVEILEKENIKRFIHVGGAAAHLGGENENWTFGRRILKFMLTVTAKPILVAKQMEWDVLKKSKLEWTLVRPPAIIKGKSKSGKLIVDDKNLGSLKVNVEDLSNFMLEQITSALWIKKAPLVSNE